MKLLLISFSILFFVSCEVKVNSANTDEKKETYSRDNKKIRNGIEFKTTGGVKVEQAFLTFEDGTLVGEENITELKRPLKLRLVVDGWKAIDGRVYLEASEKISSDEGDKVLDANNLFSGNGIDAVSPADSKVVTLDVVINGINKLVDYFLVEFRVWNTKEDQSIEGSYKFHINKM